MTQVEAENTTQTPDISQPFSFPSMFVTGNEYMWVIKEIGVNVCEFAEHISKSQNFVRQSLGYLQYDPVPVKWVKELREYAGKEVFDAGLRRVRNKIEHKRYYKDLRRVMHDTYTRV